MSAYNKKYGVTHGVIMNLCAEENVYREALATVGKYDDRDAQAHALRAFVQLLRCTGVVQTYSLTELRDADLDKVDWLAVAEGLGNEHPRRRCGGDCRRLSDPATAAAQDVYTQVACAPAGENVSQNFANTSGGGTRIDGPIGGGGWQCRSYKTTHALYMRLASAASGCRWCEIWKRVFVSCGTSSPRPSSATS